MANDLTAPEPEEAIETALATLLGASCSIPVVGVLAPSASGTVKRLSADTFVSVAADVASQEMDATAPARLYSYSVSVSVRYAMEDDPSGNGFRDECRRVRGTLAALTGDGCDALATATFGCDGFMLNSTSTSFEGDDSPSHIKTYSATIYGRVITPTTTTNSNEETN